MTSNEQVALTTLLQENKRLRAALNAIAVGTPDLLPPFRIMGEAQLRAAARKALDEIPDRPDPETPDDAKATYFRWGQALAQLTNGYKYPTEVCAIAREPYRCKAPSCAHYGDEAPQDCLCWSAVTRGAE